MSGEYVTHDEWFEHEGARYGFMFSKPGTLSNVSSSPFAPKSTTGERSYADYDAISALAITDMTGGMGQERLTDTTMYYGGVNVDTRSGSLVLGPKLTEIGPNGTLAGARYLNMGSGIQSYTYVAQKWDSPADATTLRAIWLYLRGSSVLTAITVKLYDNNNGLPGNQLATATVSAGGVKPVAAWHEADFGTPIGVTGNVTYWVVVEWTSTDDTLYWLCDETGSGEVLVWNGSTWSGTGYEDVRMTMYADDYTVRPDHPPIPFLGVGKDSIARLWLRAGRGLYYVNRNNVITPVEDGAGATKLLEGVGYAYAWYRAPGDSHNWLYLGHLDKDIEMVRFDGEIGGETWETLTGHRARALCVHNNLLVFAYDDVYIDAYDGTLWTGATPGSYAICGDATYAVRNLVSWNGNVWAGKNDGLYKITVPTGYPTTGSLSAQKIIDFLPVASDNNFAMMTVHQGDLWFNIGNGLMRYTTGDVLTPAAPDTGLNVSTSKRAIYRNGISALGTLWLLAEGDVSPGQTVDVNMGYYSGDVDVDASVLYCYYDGHFFPLAQLPRLDQLLVRGICIDPGWYSNGPRLWFGSGVRLAYCDMPTTTYRRWLVPGMNYADTGYLLTSWFDGNIRTIEKDWMAIELDIYNSDTDEASESDTVRVYWRPDEETAWEALSAAFATRGLVTLAFPADSHSTKLQLKVELASYDGTSTPRVEAIVLKYMERPEDVRSYTRTYKLASRLENRNGVIVTRSLAQQLDDLRTLREAKEPLTHHAWYGTERTVHIVDYSVSEMPDEQSEAGDKGVMLAVVRLQEVE